MRAPEADSSCLEVTEAGLGLRGYRLQVPLRRWEAKHVTSGKDNNNNNKSFNLTSSVVVLHLVAGCN